MRRILRKVASGEYDQLGDISTLADPAVSVCLLYFFFQFLNVVSHLGCSKVS
jgi:hypothetical protein